MDTGTEAALPRGTLTGLFLLLLGTSLLAISHYGTAMPYFDQWTAEGMRLFRPWLEGRFGWYDMFRPFNEHYIVTERVLALLLFELNHKVWSVMLQESVNAVIHALVLLVLVRSLLPACPPAMRPGFLLVAALVLIIPVGWENLLFSFQTQTYLMMLCSLLFVRQLHGALPLSRRWWLALPWLGVAFLSQAPAVVTAATGALMTLVHLRWPERRRAAIAGGLILLALAVAGFLLTPLMLDTPMRRGFHEATLWNRVEGLLTLLAWPAYIIEWLAPVVWLPYAVFAWRWWRQPDNRADGLVVSIGLWVLLICAATAWGRGVCPLEPRYQDILVMGSGVGWLCLLRLPATPAWRRFSMLWVIVLAVGMIMQVMLAQQALAGRKAQGDGQLRWIQHYMADAAAGHPHGCDQGEPPYPDPFCPVFFLEQPVLKPILPGVLPGTEARQADWVRLWLSALMPVSLCLSAAGIGLMGLGMSRQLRGSR
jgi:hypothetical protein